MAAKKRPAALLGANRPGLIEHRSGVYLTNVALAAQFAGRQVRR